MKPKTKAAKATKKASAKPAPITKRIKTPGDGSWYYWFDATLWERFSQRELAELCRERGIPINKSKNAMVQALAEHLTRYPREVTITIR